jgi:hypothetical protein
LGAAAPIDSSGRVRASAIYNWLRKENVSRIKKENVSRIRKEKVSMVKSNNKRVSYSKRSLLYNLTSITLIAK